MINKTLFLSLLLFTILVSGCNDNAFVNFHDNSIKDDKIQCLKLVVFPPDKQLTQTMLTLYNFKDSCKYSLYISKKGGITCNSTHNLDKKALQQFPTSYLKLMLKKEHTIAYSYYIDLKENVTNKDIKNAFKRIKNDLNIVQ